MKASKFQVLRVILYRQLVDIFESAVFTTRNA